jgi:hypothetical protein
MDDQIIVFRTGSLVEFDSVTCALKEAGIPFFTRTETSSGLRLATPVSPSVGPGDWLSVIVPRKAAEDARSIVVDFPFGDKTNPDVWDFQPTKKVQIGWKIYIWATLLIIAISAIWELIEKFTRK